VTVARAPHLPSRARRRTFCQARVRIAVPPRQGIHHGFSTFNASCASASPEDLPTKKTEKTAASFPNDAASAAAKPPRGRVAKKTRPHAGRLARPSNGFPSVLWIVAYCGRRPNKWSRTDRRRATVRWRSPSVYGPGCLQSRRPDTSKKPQKPDEDASTAGGDADGGDPPARLHAGR